MANSITHGKMSNNTGLYTMPHQYIMTKKTKMVSSRLNSSLIVSDSGKKYAGMLSALSSPADPTILPTDWPVTFEKKNQSISPEVTNRI